MPVVKCIAESMRSLLKHLTTGVQATAQMLTAIFSQEYVLADRGVAESIELIAEAIPLLCAATT